MAFLRILELLQKKARRLWKQKSQPGKREESPTVLPQTANLGVLEPVILLAQRGVIRPVPVVVGAPGAPVVGDHVPETARLPVLADVLVAGPLVPATVRVVLGGVLVVAMPAIITVPVALEGVPAVETPALIVVRVVRALAPEDVIPLAPEDAKIAALPTAPGIAQAAVPDIAQRVARDVEAVAAARVDLPAKGAAVHVLVPVLADVTVAQGTDKICMTNGVKICFKCFLKKHLCH